MAQYEKEWKIKHHRVQSVFMIMDKKKSYIYIYFLFNKKNNE